MVTYEDLYETGDEEIPGFVPTRHELRQIVKYWATTALDDKYFSFLYDADFTDPQLGWPRINAIAVFLGEEETRKAVNEALEEFGEKQDPRAWKVFRNGTPAERKQLQREVFEDVEKRMEAKGDRRARAKFYQRLSTEPREEDAQVDTAQISDEQDRSDVLYMPPLAS